MSQEQPQDDLTAEGIEIISSEAINRDSEETISKEEAAAEVDTFQIQTGISNEEASNVEVVSDNESTEGPGEDSAAFIDQIQKELDGDQKAV